MPRQLALGAMPPSRRLRAQNPRCNASTDTTHGGPSMHDPIGRPAPDEALPYYFQYIDLVPDDDIIATLARQIDDTTTFLATLSTAQAQQRPAPREWNAIELVGHLADAERVFSYR